MSAFEWIQPDRDRGRRQLQQVIRQEQSPEVRQAIQAGSSALMDMQRPEGYWCGELTADSTLESDYLLLQLWLHPPQGRYWNPPTRKRIEKACRSIVARQQADGGWNIYPGGPSELNATIRAYTALKLGGYDPHSPALLKAKERVLALGGLQAANSYTKINLGLFGLYPRQHVPTVPPELVLLPLDVLYQMSSWSRTILVPLSVVQAKGVHRPAPSGFHVEELLHPTTKLRLVNKAGLSIFFHHLDKVVKLWGRRGSKDVRAAALREAEHWMLDRTRYTEGLGAIYPAMMYFIMALDALGYATDHPDFVDAVQQFDNLILETEDRFQFQPCVSPVWDTAYAAFALGEAGLVPREALTKTADWLLTKEVRRKGDWSVKRPDLEPSGWAFEFANEYYPDIDDTAMVLLGLSHCEASDPAKQERTTRRALNWLLGMQGSDGGWAAFDVDNNWTILNRVPFADHNAMLDPSCADITGRVLECFARYGLKAGHPAVDNGVKYLQNTQQEDGSWYGRWGVNYTYGTFLALRGLQAAKEPEARPAMQKAAEWLRSVQNRDGGWGESCASYKTSRFLVADSTASQTAWGLLGLAAAGDTSSEAVHRGVEYLTRTQKADGTWEESAATGTGFPNVFYLTYHMYRQYFPVLALTTCQPHRDRTVTVSAL